MLNVLFLGLVSFFTDISTEMVYPLIPLYLSGVLGAPVEVIGIIEGIAESLASLLKVFSGFIVDKFQKKKALAFSGYATGLVYKLALITAKSWPGVLIARIIDRFGKGIRTAPRDILVSESTPRGKLGFAFGLHKALDMAGAAVGILITYFLLGNFAEESAYRQIFLISLIPAVLGLIMFFFVKEKTDVNRNNQSIKFWSSIKSVDLQIKLYLLAVFLFTLGNSSNAFLLLKAKSVGFNNQTVILLYFVFNLTAALLSIPCGKLSDKLGRKKLLVGGYLLFSLVYLGFAFVSAYYQMWLLFVVYGFHIALITGVERAFLAEIAPINLKGTVLGLLSTITGIALLPASIITGALWKSFGDTIPFVFGALLAVLAALILGLF